MYLSKMYSRGFRRMSFSTFLVSVKWCVQRASHGHCVAHWRTGRLLGARFYPAFPLVWPELYSTWRRGNVPAAHYTKLGLAMGLLCLYSGRSKSSWKTEEERFYLLEEWALFESWGEVSPSRRMFFHKQVFSEKRQKSPREIKINNLGKDWKPGKSWEPALWWKADTGPGL